MKKPFLTLLLLICVFSLASTVQSQPTTNSILVQLIGAQNDLLDAAALYRAGQQLDAIAAINQASNTLTLVATNITEPGIQSALGRKFTIVSKALALAQKLTAKANAAANATAPPQNPTRVVNAIKAAASAVSRSGSLLGRPMLAELAATTAGFHKPGQLVTFRVTLAGCDETPVITVTSPGLAPAVDAASVAFDNNTGLLTLRMGLAHGGARVQVSACGHTVTRLLYNYGVAAPRVRFINPPHAKIGQPYSQLVAQAFGGVAPYYFTLATAGGFPPLGLILDLNGMLSGTPSVPGRYTFSVCAVDLSGSQSCGLVTVIVDPPEISISDVSENEGQDGTKVFNFNVSLSVASTKTITVKYATGNLTASAGSDYVALPAATLTFNPGETQKQVAVTVNGDRTVEHNETFFVRLSSPVNATIAKASGTGTLLNDDLPEGSVALAITSQTTIPFYNDPFDYGNWIKIEGTATGPVNTYFSMPSGVHCDSWSNGQRQPGEPATTTWSVTVGEWAFNNGRLGINIYYGHNLTVYAYFP